MNEPTTPLGSRSRVRAAAVAAGILLFSFLVLWGCGSDEATNPPSFGVIHVTALTEGQEAAPDSFTVLLNWDRSGRIEANGTFVIPFLPRGDYQVALLEEQATCFYGTNARMVTVVPNDTTFTTFLVRCQ